MFVGVVRFESREAAMANSRRPEQTAWAQRMAALMNGPMEFHDCDDVTMMMGGGSDDAGFVQVIRGKVDEPARLKSMLADTDLLHEIRPETLGATLAIEPDGTFTETVSGWPHGIRLPHGGPGLRQVRAVGPHLRARAHHR